jgi:uncharacterized protein (DUF2384 family)
MKRRNIPVVSALALPNEAPNIFAPAGLDGLRRLVRTLGNSVTARLLSVDRAQVSRWNHAKEPLSHEMRSRVIDLAFVLDKAMQVYAPDVVGEWLVGSEPLFAGARPIDVFFLRGPAPLVDALGAIEEGVHV